MPSELLTQVFDQLPVDRCSNVAPISRTLCPFVQRGLFRSLYVSSVTGLDRLIQTIIARPELGSYVVDLVISLPNSADVNFDRITPRDLVRFARLLSQLRTLSLRHAFFIIHHLLRSQAAVDCLTTLVELRLFEFPVASIPTLLHTFRQLRRPYSFVRLVVRLEGASVHGINEDTDGRWAAAEASWLARCGGETFLDDVGGGEGAKGSEDEGQSIVSVTDLDILGDINKPQAIELAAIFPALKVLSLDEKVEGTPNFCAILNAVNPSALVNLELVQGRSTDAEPSPFPIDAVVARFPLLQSLKLSGRVFTPILFSHLPSLSSLTTLIFSDDTTPAYDDLAKLLSMKPSSLKKVELNQVYAERGLSQMDLDEDFEENGEIVPHPSWYPPFWESNLSRAQVDDLLRLAGAAGISLGEHIKEAIAIEDDYLKEVDLCETWQEDREAEYYGGGDTDPGEEEEPWYTDDDSGGEDSFDEE